MCLDEHRAYLESVERIDNLKEMRAAKTAATEEKLAIFTSHFSSADRSHFKVNFINYFIKTTLIS